MLVRRKSKCQFSLHVSIEINCGGQIHTYIHAYMAVLRNESTNCSRQSVKNGGKASQIFVQFLFSIVTIEILGLEVECIYASRTIKMAKKR
jgi:hypothetical protein